MKSVTPKYLILSDFNVRSNNRGTAALGYGALAFLLEKGYIDEDFEIVQFRFYRYPFTGGPRRKVNEFEINGKIWRQNIISVWAMEKLLYRNKLHFFNTLFKRTVKNVKLIAAINGGDGLTDIYGEALLDYRLPEMRWAIQFGIPFIILPQTIGPFQKESNKERIMGFLKKAKKIYVRDTNYIKELNEAGLEYELTNDLSYYMQPEPFKIDIKHPCVGINLSGLAFSNRFGNLAGEFDYYPELMKRLVKLFNEKGCHVYIIPHAYNVNKPETDNDDMVSSKDFYELLDDKKNVTFVDKDLISPQIKYLISQMDFFVGTRMHANYAAIFTGVPVFGLAYSYKFKGAFERNGIYNRVAQINNLRESEIAGLITEIENAFNEDVNKKETNNE